jgi:DNA-binding transcriptional LysR family regulator
MPLTSKSGRSCPSLHFASCHPLCAKQEISVLNLEGVDFIATAERTSSRLRTDALFSSHNVPRTIQIEALWSLTNADLVQAGLGCGIVDGFTAAPFAKRGGHPARILQDI